MNVRRTALLLALAALLCLIGGAWGAGTATADRNGKVELAVGGRAFTAQPEGPLLDTAALAPGVRIRAVLGVRSRFHVRTGLSLRLVDVHDDDNGCPPAEARVDRTCGTGQGDLGRAVVLTVDAATSPAGPFRQVWQGAATGLGTATPVAVVVPAMGDRWLRITASVPATEGNAVQTDTLRFGLRAVLQGEGARGSSGVDGARAGDSGHGHSGAGSGVLGLASTGLSTALFVIGAGLLVAAGAVLLSAGRSRRGVTSASSSTGRRGPRPTAPR